MSQVQYDDMEPLVEFVNNNKFTWDAKMNERYQGLSLSQVRSHIKFGGSPGEADHSPAKFTLAQTNVASV